MVYKEFQDLKLSALGMGTMRLPVIGGKRIRLTRRPQAGSLTRLLPEGSTITTRHGDITAGSRNW